MSERVDFSPIQAHKPGTIAWLLARSYEDFLVAGRAGSMLPSSKWPAFDAEVFENPESLGHCAFITCVAGQPIGFASWDVRCAPSCGVIGHNCVLPEHRGKGYGKMQIREVLRRFGERGCARAVVITGDDPFFVPAQRMYRACGFREVLRMACGPDLTYGTIRYERDMAVPEGQIVGSGEPEILLPL